MGDFHVFYSLFLTHIKLSPCHRGSFTQHHTAPMLEGKATVRCCAPTRHHLGSQLKSALFISSNLFLQSFFGGQNIGLLLWLWKSGSCVLISDKTLILSKLQKKKKQIGLNTLWGHIIIIKAFIQIYHNY